jgi:histidinol-phosphate aminotransferase
MPEIRDDLKGMQPYVVNEKRYTVELDSNESPWNLPDEVIEDIRGAMAGIEFNRYPDNSCAWLKQGLADSYAILPDQIVFGNGSNEVIMNLLLAYGGPGRAAMLFTPTYSMHAVQARITMTDVVEQPLTDVFELDLKSALAAIAEHRPSIVFINSPNNPTGNVVAIDAIERICVAGPHLVVVDEAYGEFSGTTCLPLIKKHGNLAIVRTFSKAYRMAAGRIGYCLADENIIRAIEIVKMPYNLNALSQAAAGLIWNKRGIVLKAVGEITAERDRVFAAMRALPGVDPYPSGANFILFKTEKDANGVFKRLLDKQVIIRNFSSKKSLNNCLRVTIGAPQENDAFLEALKESV